MHLEPTRTERFRKITGKSSFFRIACKDMAKYWQIPCLVSSPSKLTDDEMEVPPFVEQRLNFFQALTIHPGSINIASFHINPESISPGVMARRDYPGFTPEKVAARLLLAATGLFFLAIPRLNIRVDDHSPTFISFFRLTAIHSELFQRLQFRDCAYPIVTESAGPTRKS